MTPEARQELGQRTAAEVMAKGVATSEKQLQRQIVNLLRLKGVECNVSAMHKRKTDRVGWPDITFCIYTLAPQIIGDRPSQYLPQAWQTFPCAWEIKMPQGKLTKGQEAMKALLTSGVNGWRHRVIRSVDEALAELTAMGLK